MATKKTEKIVDVDVELNLKKITIPIIGTTSLIMHKFDKKGLNQIIESGKVDVEMKQGGKKKNIANPDEDYIDSIHFFSDGKTCGFPATAFKKAMVNMAGRIFKSKMTEARAAFYIEADDPETGLVKINGEHRMRTDMVRVGTINKVASPRYRAEFPKWSAVLNIRFFSDVISEKDIVKMLAAAGIGNGIGEWRPEKGGDRGMWEVTSIS
jgi:hypothetical protein